MDKIRLSRKGFKDIYIRQSESGWQILEYTDRYGHERWGSIPLTETEIQENIDKYKND